MAQYTRTEIFETPTNWTIEVRCPEDICIAWFNIPKTCGNTKENILSSLTSWADQLLFHLNKE